MHPRAKREGLDPATGRFTSRDRWGGDYKDPLTLNKWLYVNGNPINYLDPKGLWRWRFSGNTYHNLIENYYESTTLGLINPSKQLEYLIPGTTLRHPDMFNSVTGDIYEIEPFFLKSAALTQLQQYQSDLLSTAKAGLLSGNYFGVYFDWNSTPFHIGTGIEWLGKFRSPLPGFPAVDLVADFVGQGTIIYWIEPNALALVGVPFLVPNKKLVRPQNWQPGQVAQQPAYAISISEACGYGLIVIGGTLTTVTIIEDVATLGLGTFDDVISVPAGLYLIDLGRRLAVFMPVK